MVEHIFGASRTEPHTLRPWACVQGTRIIYPSVFEVGGQDASGHWPAGRANKARTVHLWRVARRIASTRLSLREWLAEEQDDYGWSTDEVRDISETFVRDRLNARAYTAAFRRPAALLLTCRVFASWQVDYMSPSCK